MRRHIIWSLAKHRHLWEDAGGIFVHHKNARESLSELARWLDIQIGSDQKR